ncbi:hypothetical protein SynRS9909_02404 [Synechococcus sp. RS9909]|uniref:hypothetical protein n=1 Tax=unclassified Synechococcus TaxID=2626047 RepID=UPI000068F969|nr:MULTISPECIES: hypothetical protein [unclassified Synechococcus]EAQ68358.1 hypothetical protein RS9917_07920 [Synechococcus sp. RS9917]QNI80378.1 hypothetical protein SynRS9909_02404 [Synechococcus sp. RS9909]
MARYLLLWVHGPWIASSLMVILALRLLMAEDFGLHGHGWGLLGSASICFSIGCVCKVSWVLSQLNRRRSAAQRQIEHLMLH